MQELVKKKRKNARASEERKEGKEGVRLVQELNQWLEHSHFDCSLTLRVSGNKKKKQRASPLDLWRLLLSFYLLR